MCLAYYVESITGRCGLDGKKIKIVMAIMMLLGVYLATYVCLPMSTRGTAGKAEESNMSGMGQEESSDASERIDIDITGKVVVIDSGHGGVDPGKTNADNSIQEKDINLSIAKKLENLLKNAGVSVIMTRTEDMGHYSEDDTNKKRADMNARCEMVNESSADAVVSIHQNSYTSPSVKGAQMFYYEGSKEGKKLAGILQKAFVTYVDSANTRVEKADDSYYMLLHTKPPTVIAECGFLSNPGEAKLLSTDEYQDKVATALYHGIMEYILE